MVEIYTTDTCSFCVKAKEFFNENDIEYTEYNVNEDDKRKEELIELTQNLSVPVIKIGEDVVVGFNEVLLRQKLL